MIANHKGEIPVVLLLLPFVAGIAIGFNFIPASWLLCLSIAFGTLTVLFIILNIYYRRLNIYKIRWLGGFLVCIILLLAGCIAIVNYQEINKPDHFSKTPAKLLLVRINNEPQLKNGLTRFAATVDEAINNSQAIKTTGTLLVTVKDSAAQYLSYGDELLIQANYTLVDPPFNPAEFNYKRYLQNQNIYHQSFLYTGQYKIIKHDTGNQLVAYSINLRRQMVDKFKQQLHDSNALAVASTLILGYKADLSNDILQTYSKTGTIHVLSVSGAHVAIIYFILQWALGFLGNYRYGKLLRAVIFIMLIWAYAMLTGFSPAVCRAAVMISMVIAGHAYNRYINNLNILAISAFALLLYDPLFIVDVGFQLSYLAVAGLIVLQPVVYKRITFKNKWADKLWAICSVSLAAQVITFPLSAFYFHQFPVCFLLSNLFIIIPTMIIMYSGLLYLCFSWVPVISTTLAFILEKSILFMNKALVTVENAPFASISKIWLTTTEYLLLYAIIIGLFYFLYDRKAWLLRLSLLLTLLLCISISLKRYQSASTNSIAFLNLRKNNGLVFKSGNSAVVISNLADTDKNYRYSVQPYLDSSKVSNISLIAPDNKINTNYLSKQGNLIQFYDKRILLVDKKWLTNLPPQKLKTDYIFITGNPHINMQQLKKTIDFKHVVIDAGNTNRIINDLEAEAIAMHTDYYVLKRNKSLIIVSN